MTKLSKETLDLAFEIKATNRWELNDFELIKAAILLTKNDLIREAFLLRNELPGNDHPGSLEAIAMALGYKQ